MSGTRSPFPKAPATEAAVHRALIVAHGQPTDPAPPEAAMARLGRQVQGHLTGWRVHCATLAMPGRLEAMLARLPERVLVYPFFMSDGWFVRRALPDRLACAGAVTLTAPFGLDPDLPVLAAGMIRRAMDRHGLSGRHARIVLSAHGSGRGPDAARAAHDFAARLQGLLPGATVSTGFIEQAPNVRDVAGQTGSPAISLPFLANNGDHYRRDILQALKRARFAGVLLPVLGTHQYVPGLIARTLENAATQRAAA